MGNFNEEELKAFVQHVAKHQFILYGLRLLRLFRVCKHAMWANIRSNFSGVISLSAI